MSILELLGLIALELSKYIISEPLLIDYDKLVYNKSNSYLLTSTPLDHKASKGT